MLANLFIGSPAHHYTTSNCIIFLAAWLGPHTIKIGEMQAGMRCRSSGESTMTAIAAERLIKAAG